MSEVDSVCFDNSETLVAAGCHAGQTRIWDLNKKQDSTFVSLRSLVVSRHFMRVPSRGHCLLTGGRGEGPGERKRE